MTESADSVKIQNTGFLTSFEGHILSPDVRPGYIGPYVPQKEEHMVYILFKFSSWALFYTKWFFNAPYFTQHLKVNSNCSKCIFLCTKILFY